MGFYIDLGESYGPDGRRNWQLIWRDEVPDAENRLFWVDGPWKIPLKADRYVAIEEELETLLRQVLIRVEARRGLRKLHYRFWEPGTFTPSASGGERKSVGAWLRAPRSRAVFYGVWESAFAGMRVLSVHGDRPGEGQIGPLWGRPYHGPFAQVFAEEGPGTRVREYRLARIDGVRIRTSDLKAFRLDPATRLRAGSVSLADAIKRFRETDVYVKGRTSRTLFTDTEFRQLARLYYKTWWAMEDEIAHLPGGSPSGRRGRAGKDERGAAWWEKMWKEGLRIMMKHFKEGQRRFERNGWPDQGRKIFDVERLKREFEVFRVAAKDKLGLPLSTKEQQPLNEWLKGLGVSYSYWGTYLICGDENIDRQGTEVLDRLERVLRGHFGLDEGEGGDMAKAAGEAQEELRKLRNPSGSTRARQLAERAEGAILSRLRAIGIPRYVAPSPKEGVEAALSPPAGTPDLLAFAQFVNGPPLTRTEEGLWRILDPISEQFPQVSKMRRSLEEETAVWDKLGVDSKLSPHLDHACAHWHELYCRDLGLREFVALEVVIALLMDWFDRNGSKDLGKLNWGGYTRECIDAFNSRSGKPRISFNSHAGSYYRQNQSRIQNDLGPAATERRFWEAAKKAHRRHLRHRRENPQAERADSSRFSRVGNPQGNAARKPK